MSVIKKEAAMEIIKQAKEELIICIEKNPQIIKALTTDSRRFILKSALKNNNLKEDYSPAICEAFNNNLIDLTLPQVIEIVKRDKLIKVEKALDLLIMQVNEFADEQEEEELMSLYCHETLE